MYITSCPSEGANDTCGGNRSQLADSDVLGVGGCAGCGGMCWVWGDVRKDMALLRKQT